MRDSVACPTKELPRECLAKYGAASVSDAGLLSILIGFGTKGHPVQKVAEKVRKIMDLRNGDLALEDLAAIKGIGLAKATQLLAALEFARRRIRPEGVKIREPKDILPLLQHFADRKQEHFISTSLNGAHEVIKTRVITIGLVNAAQVHPREVFCDAISDRAVALIVAHNHPSGGVEPSQEDVQVTKRLKEAGEILGIKLLDHVIFGRGGFFSFMEMGRL